MPIRAKYVHTNLIARDWKRLVRFYCDVFGCEPAGPERDMSGGWLDSLTSLPNAHLTGVHLRLPGYGDDGPTLEIFSYDQLTGCDLPAANKCGLAHIAFAVDDVDQALQAVIAGSGSIVGNIAITDVNGVGSLRVVYARDPEGNIVEFRSGASALTPKINIEARSSVIAYWLIPAEPAHSFFQRMIKDLASRYDAPFFEPHVTIYVGANDANAAEKALSKAARECQAINLKALGINHSDEFIKTLFVQFAMNRKLRQLYQTIRNAGHDLSKYELNPHLSLLYKNIPATARRELADSIKVPFSEVIFDSLKAVCCISPTQNGAEVEAWRVVAGEAWAHSCSLSARRSHVSV